MAGEKRKASRLPFYFSRTSFRGLFDDLVGAREYAAGTLSPNEARAFYHGILGLDER